MKIFKHIALVTALLCCGAANASIISDYTKSDVAANGWTIVYQGGYGATFNYGDVLNHIAAGSKVALASSSSTAASTFDLFANTSLVTLQTVTSRDTTIFADNAYWYRNSSSVGFAPSASIWQNSADITNSRNSGIANALDGDQRLSWHGGLTNVSGGWRSGLNTSLNSNNTWQRYVLVQSGQPRQNVPEPASLALLGLGLAGLAAVRRRAPKKV